MTDKQDLLFELGTEELPPVALKHLSEVLRDEFARGLDKAGLEHGHVESFATPRRLALLVNECAMQQPHRTTERRGPAVSAAFDDNGNPTRAAEGFARSCNTEVETLQRVKTDKGEWLAYTIHEQGKAAHELLPAIAEAALSRLPIPKRMRWGSSEAQFVRPVHWLLFMHGENVVSCRLLDADASNITYGHRFHYPEPIEITQPSEYAHKLENIGHVIAEFSLRRQKIHDQVVHAAETLGGRADLDEQLLDEVCALVEWPVPITASFEEHYLEVPHEALIYTMKKNQKYFPLLDTDNRLMNHFITIANIDSPMPELIRDGNERVIRPRLADAMFFWQQDGKQKLADHVESLKSVVFQQKLGSLYDKSQRIADLAEFIAGEIEGDPVLAKRAGMLSRCDLMTETVGEFAEMQGIMGRHQALRDGEPAELARAMDEFYMPRFSGDALPQSKTGIAISLAEKLDTIIGIFAIDMKPTGDKDPFALRRAALGALRILKEHALPLDLMQLLTRAYEQLTGIVKAEAIPEDVYGFMMDRLKGLYHDAGISVELFESVAAVKPLNIADFDRRIQAVSLFQTLSEAESLAAANKRIRNILKKSDSPLPESVDEKQFESAEEKQLYQAILDAQETIAPMLGQGQYEDALKSLATLRNSVDDFFDTVMVMVEDPAIRNNRLALLQQLAQLFLQVADISRLK
jgi:glycyl-tRNA synthetase beta chain